MSKLLSTLHIVVTVLFIMSEVCPEPDTTTTPPPTTTPEPDNGKALENLQKGNIAYTGEFFYQEYLKSNGKSFVTSPFSVLIPLGQLGYFAEGKTYDQIMAALNLKTKSDILNAFPSLIKNYQTQQDVVFELASKCFTNDEYPITDKFLEITSKYFFSEAQEVDFSKPQEVSDTINKYVADKTHDKIQNLVAPSMFNRDTRLALVNAVYFKGNWVHQFNENKTKTEDFYVTKTDTVPVSMMNLKTSFRYGENDDAQFLELPYKGGNFTCLIVLPKEIDGLASVIEKLRKSETFDQINENLKYEQVNARIPRLKIETTIDLGELFKLTGLGQLPNPESNDLKGIIKNDQPIYMSKGVQKAFIVVNEVGTEAAAANALIFTTTAVLAPPKTYEFNANRPFILYIKLNKNPIFCTIFTGVN